MLFEPQIIIDNNNYDNCTCLSQDFTSSLTGAGVLARLRFFKHYIEEFAVAFILLDLLYF